MSKDCFEENLEMLTITIPKSDTIKIKTYHLGVVVGLMNNEDRINNDEKHKTLNPPRTILFIHTLLFTRIFLQNILNNINRS